MGMPSMPELLIILTIIVLLFGAKKIPDLAKGIGSGIKNFKKAMKEEDSETTVAQNDQTKINNPQQTQTSNTQQPTQTPNTTTQTHS
ncbi:MAG: twin-arginine translocase TatA/TatE family subunit [Campylobacterales bacterium]|nr:twin-arginine translocase TatA/TatE family subunit [Campylobacterales bacterium]